MTPRKTLSTVPKRPELEDCLERWFRCEGGEAAAKGVKLGLGNDAYDKAPFSNYDWYCYELVQTTLRDLAKIGYEIEGYRRLLYHVCSKRFLFEAEKRPRLDECLAGFRLFVVVSGRKTAESEGADRASDLEFHGMLYSMWRGTCELIRRTIDREPPFVELAVEEGQ